MKFASARTKGAVLALALATVAAGVVAAQPAAAHGSVTNPPTRNYGCFERWGDDHLNPDMATEDPMCWGAFQADPNAMWNWNGLYRENVGGNHEAAIPNGQLCSGGHTQDGRYNYLDTPGPWVAKGVPNNFRLTLTDGAKHGADYLRIYVSKPGFDPTREALGWDDLTLVKETGRYGTTGLYETDLSIPGRSGRAVLFTIWQASHLDQPYYLCSDINIGGGDLYPGGGEGPGQPTTPPTEPTTPPTEPTTPPTEPTTPPTEPGTGECTATVTVVNSWSGGYQAEVVVKAGAGGTSSWKATVGGATITQAWSATLTAPNVLSNETWNGSLGAGASTTAGFLGSGSPSGLTASCTA